MSVSRYTATALTAITTTTLLCAALTPVLLRSIMTAVHTVPITYDGDQDPGDVATNDN